MVRMKSDMVRDIQLGRVGRSIEVLRLQVLDQVERKIYSIHGRRTDRVNPNDHLNHLTQLQVATAFHFCRFGDEGEDFDLKPFS